MTYLTVADVQLYFEDYPARCTPGERLFDTALLVHGWACNSSDWSALVERLSAYGRVITVDQRGCGRSSRSTSGYSPTSMAQDLVALLDHLKLERVLAFGHSAGAEVASALAVLHPERVTALVSVDPAYGAPAHDRERIAFVADQLAGDDTVKVISDYFARLDDTPGTAPEIAEAHQRLVLSCQPDVAREMFRSFAFGPDNFHFRPSTDEFLARRQCPLFALYRNEERASAGSVFATRHHDKVVVYPGSGHWPHQEQPDRFITDVTAWLSQITPPLPPTDPRTPGSTS